MLTRLKITPNTTCMVLSASIHKRRCTEQKKLIKQAIDKMEIIRGRVRSIRNPYLGFPVARSGRSLQDGLTSNRTSFQSVGRSLVSLIRTCFTSKRVALFLILLLILTMGCQVSWDTCGNGFIIPMDKNSKPVNRVEKEVP